MKLILAIMMMMTLSACGEKENILPPPTRVGDNGLFTVGAINNAINGLQSKGLQIECKEVRSYCSNCERRTNFRCSYNKKFYRDYALLFAQNNDVQNTSVMTNYYGSIRQTLKSLITNIQDYRLNKLKSIEGDYDRWREYWYSDEHNLLHNQELYFRKLKRNYERIIRDLGF